MLNRRQFVRSAAVAGVAATLPAAVNADAAPGPQGPAGAAAIQGAPPAS